mmetsp:Transcript_16673/g.40501  ORF Transcript_16673/g.40501 Transcript_16673/m.40501 type:complete len:319 (-) Transcript_16673:167-1123(-)|eukprot:CAMPEP_0113467444 /NCGR_PEP_ID=MMETSP0014_2-20120614/14817_1 /TAXON_ID=2857 /ORGANISM="Nitzschia sp." /LENGTH=318 /DNA_ID=CAMNT_0000359751 /DNA_START=260 /DNA_END=1216 /DNA_ORIENTATION=- /assembly_acc=CAM_ASM_000159
MFGGLFRPSSAPPAPVSEPVSAMESSSSSLSSQPGPVHHQPPIIYRRQRRQCQQRSTASSSSQASSSQVSAVPSNDSTVDRRNLSQSWPSTVKNRGDAIVDSNNATVDGDNNNNIDDHLRAPALWKRRYIRHHKQPSSQSLPLPQKHQPQQQQEKTKRERRRLRPSSILSLPSSLPGQNHHSSSSFSVSASSSPITTTAATTTKPSVFFLAGHPSSKLQREESYRHGLEILTQMGQTTNDAMRRHRGEMMERDLDILSGLATESTATSATTASLTEGHDNENSTYDEYFMSFTGGSVSAGGTVISTTAPLKRDSSLSL